MEQKDWKLCGQNTNYSWNSIHSIGIIYVETCEQNQALIGSFKLDLI